jgi:hypothetical protein
MIQHYPCGDLRPVGDSLPKRTWRGEGPLVLSHYRCVHRFPESGCQGEPLPARKPQTCRTHEHDGAAALLPSMRAEMKRYLRCSGGEAGTGLSLGACACEETP